MVQMTAQERGRVGMRDRAKWRGAPESGDADVAEDEDYWTSGQLRRSAYLAVDVAAARVGRVFAGAVLADWRLTARAGDVCLCVSELVSNAYRHAEADRTAERGDRPRLIRLTLALDGGRLRVQVRDGDPRLPVIAPAPADPAEPAESGHGLRIVQGLAGGLGWWRVGVGKVVECWFTADVPAGWR